MSLSTIKGKVTLIIGIIALMLIGHTVAVSQLTGEQSTQLTTFANILYLVALGGLWFVLNKSIFSPLKELNTVTQGLAEGDISLAKRVDIKGDGDIANIARSANQFIERIQTTITSVESCASEIQMTVSSLTDIAQSTNIELSSQLQATEVVATAMNEMMASSSEVANNAEETANFTKVANSDTQNGNTVVAKSVNAITALASDMEHTEAVVISLGEDSNNIGSVLDVIKGIAEQTNLLALNAAIEAARAGEQGRGFAVVADEVRTLASRTQESAQEINDMITRLQGSVKEVTTVISGGLEQARKSVAEGQQAQESLNAIANSVANIDNMTNLIATAAKEQSVVTNDIDRNIIAITDAARRHVDSTGSVASSSQQAIALTSQLHGLMQQFNHG